MQSATMRGTGELAKPLGKKNPAIIYQLLIIYTATACVLMVIFSTTCSESAYPRTWAMRELKDRQWIRNATAMKRTCLFNPFTRDICTEL